MYPGWKISPAGYFARANIKLRAMEGALAALAAGEPAPSLLPFADLQAVVGFPEYDEALAGYATRAGEGAEKPESGS